jgi:hypothetical protein
MKRIYISFITTVTIALMATLVAFVERDKNTDVVTLDNNTHIISVKDSTFLEFASGEKLFN